MLYHVWAHTLFSEVFFEQPRVFRHKQKVHFALIEVVLQIVELFFFMLIGKIKQTWPWLLSSWTFEVPVLSSYCYQWFSFAKVNLQKQWFTNWSFFFTQRGSQSMADVSNFLKIASDTTFYHWYEYRIIRFRVNWPRKVGLRDLSYRLVIERLVSGDISACGPILSLLAFRRWLARKSAFV